MSPEVATHAGAELISLPGYNIDEVFHRALLPRRRALILLEQGSRHIQNLDRERKFVLGLKKEKNPNLTDTSRTDQSSLLLVSDLRTTYGRVGRMIVQLVGEGHGFRAFSVPVAVSGVRSLNDSNKAMKSNSSGRYIDELLSEEVNSPSSSVDSTSCC